MSMGFDPEADSPDLPEHIPYASLIGSLNYAAICTRPDIAYAVNILCRYMTSAKQIHWQAAKRILRYLKKTKHYGITYDRAAGSTLSAYCDASFAIAPKSKSVSGNCLMLNNAAVLWMAACQKTVAQSTAEAEYYSLGTAAQDVIFMRELLHHLGLPQDEATEYSDLRGQSSMHLYCQQPPHKQEGTSHYD